MDTKMCVLCEQQLPFACFFRASMPDSRGNRRSNDGYLGRCNLCTWEQNAVRKREKGLDDASEMRRFERYRTIQAGILAYYATHDKMPKCDCGCGLWSQFKSDGQPRPRNYKHSREDDIGRYCSKCEKFKKWDEFHSDKHTNTVAKRKSACSTCVHEEMAERKKRNPGYRAKLSKRAKERHEAIEKQMEANWIAEHGAMPECECGCGKAVRMDIHLTHAPRHFVGSHKSRAEGYAESQSESTRLYYELLYSGSGYLDADLVRKAIRDLKKKRGLTWAEVDAITGIKLKSRINNVRTQAYPHDMIVDVLRALGNMARVADPEKTRIRQEDIVRRDRSFNTSASHNPEHRLSRI